MRETFMTLLYLLGIILLIYAIIVAIYAIRGYVEGMIKDIKGRKNNNAK